MTDTPPRYEFRVFAPDLSWMEARIRTLAPLGRYRESLETYLLVPGRNEVNLKIRDGALELKRLIERRRGLEQWRPEFRLDLPADGPALAEHLKALVNLGQRLDEGGPRDAEDLFALLAEAQPGVATASLFKKRFGFVLDDCLAEVVEVLINGARLMSVALESEEPRAVLALRVKLGMEGWDNVSYVLAAERVLGRAPLPEDAFYNARNRLARAGSDGA
jgi:exopolyphosphatase / guanosine-5'-triphosphate,3'-diphosphate pyrophosphatase